jgi:hypothetical protein
VNDCVDLAENSIEVLVETRTKCPHYGQSIRTLVY